MKSALRKMLTFSHKIAEDGQVSCLLMSFQTRVIFFRLQNTKYFEEFWKPISFGCP